MAEQAKIDRLKTGEFKIGVLFNTMGGQARKRNLAIRQVLTEIPQVTIHEATNSREFQASMDSLLRTEIDLLVIIGGDGTIHAVLSYLFATLQPGKWPVLMLVPGGTTNMTSLGLGVQGKPEQVLQRLYDCLLKPSEPVLVTHPVLRIEQTGSKRIHGMFFAVGLVARGVRFSRSSIKQLGITGGIFTILIMLRSLAGMILGRHQAEWGPVELAMSTANREASKGTYLFALVSTLDCLLLGIRPYWGKAQAPLHVTMVDQHRKHLWRSLWPLLSGRGHQLKEQDGYHSHNVNTLELLMDDEYIVDGELYQASSLNGPLCISATDPVTFLVL